MAKMTHNPRSRQAPTTPVENALASVDAWKKTQNGAPSSNGDGYAPKSPETMRGKARSMP